MRVLHVINSLGASGGAEHGLVREITRFRNVEQTVVRLFEKDQLDGELAAAGIPVVGLGLQAGRAAYNWPEAVRRLRPLIRAFAPDVVHTSLFTGNLVGQLAARSLRLPVVSTMTLSGDVSLLRQFQPGADSPFAGILRWIAGAAARGELIRFRALTNDAAVTNADALGIDLDNVEVIPRGLPPLVAPSGLGRDAFGIPDDVPLFLNVGRQAAQKGHTHLFDAFVRILERAPDAHLAIAGRTGDATEPIHAKVRELRLSDRIHLLGYRPDVADLMAVSDVFVFSSLMEGLGTAVLEAMRAGLPIAAFDIPPVREVTDDGRCAILVPVADDAALAKAAMDLLRSEQGAALSESGHRLIGERFDIDAVADRVEQLLRRVAVA